ETRPLTPPPTPAPPTRGVPRFAVLVVAAALVVGAVAGGAFAKGTGLRILSAPAARVVAPAADSSAEAAVMDAVRRANDAQVRAFASRDPSAMRATVTAQHYAEMVRINDDLRRSGVSSSNGSGYAATGGTFTAVSGAWTVPQVSATTAGLDATWVGIGGMTTNDLIQAGTQAMVSGRGGVQYEAWIELLPRSSQTVPL